MRLIDADKLVEVCRKGWKLFGRENEKLKHWVDEYDINAQPTVEAIPIEWIKSKKIEYEHDRYDYVRGCFDGFNDCIDYFIDEWEKETETN